MLNYLELYNLVDRYWEGSIWAKIKMWYYFGSVQNALMAHEINRSVHAAAESGRQKNIKDFAQKKQTEEKVYRGKGVTDPFRKHRDGTFASTSSHALRDEDDDGMDLVTGMVIGSMLTNNNSTPTTTSDDSFSGFGQGGDFGGGGAGGSWGADEY